MDEDFNKLETNWRGDKLFGNDKKLCEFNPENIY